MKKMNAIFLILCMLLTGACAANSPETVENTGSATSAGTTLAETTTTTTAPETTTTTSAATTTAETTTTTTAPETTITTSAATTTAETTTTTTAPETTTTTSAATTTAETTTTTTAPETTTTVSTTAKSTAVTTAKKTAEKTTAASTEAETTTAPKKTKKTTTTAAEKTETVTTTTAETTTEADVPAEAPTGNAIEQLADGSLRIFGESYVMTFGDEFNGDKLDLLKWSKCPEWRRQDKNCYWDDDCSYLNGEGQLVLEANYDGDFHMGGIRSKGKFEQAYGYFEVKCTLNTTPGWWTAFWLMCETVQEGSSGAQGTEVDIYESAFFNESEVQHTLNWNGYGAGHQALGSRTKMDGLYDGSYHTFSLLWTEEEYIFFIDGEETWRTDAAEAEGTCTVPLYLKMTAETGSWTFKDMDETLLPDSILVDYIRVYQKA